MSEAGCAGLEEVASHRCEVVEHRAVNDRYHHLRLVAQADLASSTAPGQFYQLRCPAVPGLQTFLLRPMSVYSIGPAPGAIEFLYSATGTGTKALTSVRVGDSLDIVGPLGQGFSLKPSWRRVMVVVRGVGLATLASLAQVACQREVQVTAIMSARRPDDLMHEEFVRGAPMRVHRVFDSDGSSDIHAVESLVRETLQHTRHDAIYTCGSHRLMAMLQRVLEDYPDVRGEVALEQRMACGMGVCLSCVRLFQDGGERRFLRVCREGPVFPIRTVIGEANFG